MAVKTTGVEFKRFYADAEYWPEGEDYVWHDEALILVNGAEMESEEGVDAIPDDAVVRIEGGLVFGPKWAGNEPTLETYFRRWRKQQSTVSFLVACDVSKRAAIEAAILAAGGRLVK